MKQRGRLVAVLAGVFLASASLAADSTNTTAQGTGMKAALPKLVDLGAGKCIPCKAMAPILEDLKKTYEGKLIVEFIDVWKNPSAAKPYKIKLIPTQIFYSADGMELFRHEGFFGKDDILAKWKELGVNLTEAAPQGRKQP
jgi:thioredoxin 1